MQRPYGSGIVGPPAPRPSSPTNTIFLAFLVYDVSHVLLEYPRLGSHGRRRAPRALRGGVARLRLEPRLPVALRVADWGAVDASLKSALGAHPVRKGRHATHDVDEPRVRVSRSFLGRVVVYGLGLLHLFRSWEPHVEERAVRVPGLRVVCALFVAGYGLNLVWFRRIVRVASRPRARRGRLEFACAGYDNPNVVPTRERESGRLPATAVRSPSS